MDPERATSQRWTAPGSRFRRAGRVWARQGVSEPRQQGTRLAGGGYRRGVSLPVGVGRAVFGGRCAFCFVLILSEVALNAVDRVRRARGSAFDACSEVATACGAVVPGCSGRAKVQV